jgi:NAD(P)-dependent dehydrogenase (short-subunit alcohol dehydrogenase family)
MKKKGGKIINISSVASGQAGVGGARIAHYVASKGGVAALTEALAVELATYKINVNAIGPGFIETDMTDELVSDQEARQGLLARIPWGRFGKPADIGAVAAFLASDEADYLTGALIFVDGGWLAS